MTQRRTVAARALDSRIVMRAVSHLPVPLALARPFLVRDNRQENAAGGWSRLHAPSESARYRAVRALCEAYARDGFVLDVGCSQGILAEGLTYARYVGIDSYAEPLHPASARADAVTSFCQENADTFMPDQPPDVVVFNEVLYYLRRPAATVDRYATLVAPGGVLVVSLYLHSWATRRLLRRLAARYRVCAQHVVAGESQLAWVVTAFRPEPA